MNTNQKTSVVKYLYDISKGLMLATIAGIMIGAYTPLLGILAIFAAIVSFFWAYDLEGEIDV